MTTENLICRIAIAGYGFEIRVKEAGIVAPRINFFFADIPHYEIKIVHPKKWYKAKHQVPFKLTGNLMFKLKYNTQRQDCR